MGVTIGVRPNDPSGNPGGSANNRSEGQRAADRVIEQEKTQLAQAIQLAERDGNSEAVNILTERLLDVETRRDQGKVPGLGRIPGLQRVFDILQVPGAAVAGGFDELLTGGFDGERRLDDFADRLLPGGRRAQAGFADLFAQAGAPPIAATIIGLGPDIFLDPLNGISGAGSIITQLGDGAGDIAKLSRGAGEAGDAADLAQGIKVAEAARQAANAADGGTVGDFLGTTGSTAGRVGDDIFDFLDNADSATLIDLGRSFRRPTESVQTAAATNRVNEGRSLFDLLDRGIQADPPPRFVANSKYVDDLAQAGSDAQRTLDDLEAAEAAGKATGAQRRAAARALRKEERAARNAANAANRTRRANEVVDDLASDPKFAQQILDPEDGVNFIRDQIRTNTRIADEAYTALDDGVTDFNLRRTSFAPLLDADVPIKKVRRITRQAAVSRLVERAGSFPADKVDAVKELALKVERSGLSALGATPEARRIATQAGLWSGLSFAGHAIPYTDVIWSKAARPFGEVAGALRGSQFATAYNPAAPLARRLTGRRSLIKAAAQANDPEKFAKAVAAVDYRAMLNTRSGTLVREFTNALARRIMGNTEAVGADIEDVLRAMDTDSPEFFAALADGTRDTFTLTRRGRKPIELDLNAIRAHQREMNDLSIMHNIARDGIKTDTWIPRNVGEWRDLLLAASGKDVDVSAIERIIGGAKLKKGDILLGETLQSGRRSEIARVVTEFVRKNVPQGFENFVNNPGLMLQGWHQYAARRIATRQVSRSILMEAAAPGSAFQLGTDVGLTIGPLDMLNPQTLATPNGVRLVQGRIDALAESIGAAGDPALIKALTAEKSYLEDAKRLLDSITPGATIDQGSLFAANDSRALWAHSLVQEAQLAALGRELFPDDIAALGDLRSIVEQTKKLAVDNFTKIVGSSDPRVMLSPEVAELIMPTFTEMGPFVNWLTRQQGLFKAMALLTPGFHVRNAYGGMFNNWVAGVGARDYWDYLSVVKRLQAGESLPEARRFFRELGLDEVTSVGQPSELGNILESTRRGRRQRVTSALNRGQEAVDRATGRALGLGARGTVEQHLRGALAWSEYRKGGTVTQARDAISKYHFDYWDLTPTEQTVRAFVPFYTWTARNLPLTFEMMARRPSKYVHILDAREDSVDWLEDQGAVFPSYFSGLFGIPIAGAEEGEQRFFMPDLPFTGAISFVDDLVGEQGVLQVSQPNGGTGFNFRPDRALEVALSSSSPIIKIIGESLTQRKSFSGERIDTWEKFPTAKWTKAVPGAEHLFDILSFTGLTRVDAEGDLSARGWVINGLENALPFFSRAGRLIPSGDEDGFLNMLQVWNIMSGMTVRDVSSDASLGHAYESLERTKEIIQAVQ